MEKQNQTIEITNLILAIIIIVSNLFLIPMNFDIIKNDGVPMGIGYIIFPILTACNLFIISAILALFKKFRNNKLLLFLNIIGRIFLLSCNYDAKKLRITTAANIVLAK